MTKRVISMILVFVLSASVFGISANATGIGACTHMAQGKDVAKTVKAAEDTALTWMRDDLLWSQVEA